MLTYINSNEVEQIFLLWQTGVILGGKCVTKFDTKSEEEKKVAQKKRGNPNPEDLKNKNEKKVQEHFLTTWGTNTLNPSVQWFGGDSNSHYVSFSPSVAALASRAPWLFALTSRRMMSPRAVHRPLSLCWSWTQPPPVSTWVVCLMMSL